MNYDRVIGGLSVELILSVLGIILCSVALVYNIEGIKKYEPGEWVCESVRFPKFQDGKMFRSGECVLWRKIINENDYDEVQR